MCDLFHFGDAFFCLYMILSGGVLSVAYINFNFDMNGIYQMLLSSFIEQWHASESIIQSIKLDQHSISRHTQNKTPQF